MPPEEEEGGGEAAVVVAPAAATAQLDVMKLSVAQLKAELKKRGRVTAGNKSVLQVRLKGGDRPQRAGF